MEFHLLLAEVSGNPFLSILLRSVIEILRDIACAFFNLSFEKELFQIHQNIFRTITPKKVSEVKRFVETDILFVRKNLKTFLKAGMDKS
jgi:DNA-binding FadR family transcriptional regulator